MSDNITELKLRIEETKSYIDSPFKFPTSEQLKNQVAIMSAQVEILQRLTPKEPEKPRICIVQGCNHIAVAGEMVCASHLI